ncbi:hypothetical protein CHS0354_018527 [Potamilus streckersoni]|uniref:3,4-dihydroxy-2-butanone-4-phosphate synthase n=1 Tax=Potamilus streckersoni TaxID=2493646 RepID=A0AAE0WA05_9BIVA|nr:hypothetical protein CHS0354_018527 [Potamilus streckersoni]
MRMSVGVVWDSARQKFYAYLEDKVDELIAHLLSGPRIIGFNHLNFDFPVLAGYGGKDEENRQNLLNRLTDAHNLDLMADMRERHGFRPSLESIARPTLAVGKSADGLMALRHAGCFSLRAKQQYGYLPHQNRGGAQSGGRLVAAGNPARAQDAIREIKAGRMIILVDDEDRENEGDICCAAEYITPEAVNFMAKYARGLICLTLTEEQTARLQLPMMTTGNRSPFHTNFTVSIEAASGVTTGISAADRAHTILTAAHPNARPDDIVVPGIFFLCVRGRAEFFSAPDKQKAR